jgi:hypothetical protein
MASSLPPARFRVPPRLALCPSCQQHVIPGSETCPNCGADLATEGRARADAAQRLQAMSDRLQALLPREGMSPPGEVQPPAAFLVSLPARRWNVMSGAEKLLARVSLPGAYVYDQCAEALQRSRARGMTAVERLSAALPASWLLNSKAPSTALQWWLGTSLRNAWMELVPLVEGGPEAWLARSEDQRRQAVHQVSQLCMEGLGLADVSKVLALLAPETVPLMDDAAVAFVTGGVPMPEREDERRAGPEHFLPMMDAFTRAVADAKDALRALCQTHPFVVLEPAQALDRLLWFDSWGIHLMPELAQVSPGA